MAALFQVAHAEIELRIVVEVREEAFSGPVERQIGPDCGKQWIGPQVRRDFLGLALLDGGAGSQQRLIVLDGHLDGLVECDADRLSECRRHHQG